MKGGRAAAGSRRSRKGPSQSHGLWVHIIFRTVAECQEVNQVRCHGTWGEYGSQVGTRALRSRRLLRAVEGIAGDVRGAKPAAILAFQASIT